MAGIATKPMSLKKAGGAIGGALFEEVGRFKPDHPIFIFCIVTAGLADLVCVGCLLIGVATLSIGVGLVPLLFIMPIHFLVGAGLVGYCYAAMKPPTELLPKNLDLKNIMSSLVGIIGAILRPWVVMLIFTLVPIPGFLVLGLILAALDQSKFVNMLLEQLVILALAAVTGGAGLVAELGVAAEVAEGVSAAAKTAKTVETVGQGAKALSTGEKIGQGAQEASKTERRLRKVADNMPQGSDDKDTESEYFGMPQGPMAAAQKENFPTGDDMELQRRMDTAIAREADVAGIADVASTMKDVQVQTPAEREHERQISRMEAGFADSSVDRRVAEDYEKQAAEHLDKGDRDMSERYVAEARRFRERQAKIDTSLEERRRQRQAAKAAAVPPPPPPQKDSGQIVDLRKKPPGETTT